MRSPRAVFLSLTDASGLVGQRRSTCATPCRRQARRSELEVITDSAEAALPHDSQLADVHGDVWDRRAGAALGGVNDVALCPRFAVCCRLSGGSDIAAGNRLRLCPWSFPVYGGFEFGCQ